MSRWIEVPTSLHLKGFRATLLRPTLTEPYQMLTRTEGKPMTKQRHNVYSLFSVEAITVTPIGNQVSTTVVQADDLVHAERLAAQWAKVFKVGFDSLVVEQTDGESS